MDNKFFGSVPEFLFNLKDMPPAVIVDELKFAGVKGINNLGIAILSYVVIMGILVNSIKHNSKVEKPNGSKNNSFPSDHTAMDFTNTCFLHKGYDMMNPGLGDYFI